MLLKREKKKTSEELVKKEKRKHSGSGMILWIKQPKLQFGRTNSTALGITIMELTCFTLSFLERITTYNTI